MRIRSSLKNLTFALGGQVIGLLVSFFARIVFIQVLGAEYLGLNGLFTNILTILSLVELGIGPAMTFSLYKPLANNNIDKVKSLMWLYKKAYISIGILLLILGISFTPFLEVFIKTIPNIPHIHVIFLLFVINSAISYFYSYKRSLIISDQKRYIATLYRYSFFVVLNIVQITVLFITQNFILFLICQIIATLAENIAISRKANKLYPYLVDRNVQTVDKSTLKEITKNVRAMIAHKLGGVVVTATDSLIISKFVGLVGVGLYSNYQLIINALNIITTQIFSSITASVGNLGATETDDKKKSIFNVVFFVNFWIYSFISICLMVLVNPFIKLWIGDDFVLQTNIVLIIIINFFLTGMRQGVLTFREALGLYWYDRHKPIFEAIINFVGSLILVNYFGMIGVFIGTTISTITTCFWVEPYVLYKYGFNSSVLPFFKKYLIYTFVTFITCLITLEVANYFQGETILNFIIRIFISIVIPNLFFLLIFFKTDEFKYLYKLGTKIILNNFKKTRL
ncbi:lipopolysaccharide biosynthesis protein [Bacillus salacetis]|uniref:lipopolysaccharide biosynthesis protein n=1 Tax=Bacillus salacetis TaxID=2315464 RepID=UPI003BA35010